MINESDIKELVARLPECYQPIFNFPQLNERISRQCDDRLVVIRRALQDLSQLYGRPLRVLDLGCAQGFFSLSVADLAESVLGIDYLAANIDVCNAARDAANLSHVRFETGDITDIIQRIAPGEFDVVLGLSVFHHLCHTQGWPVVAQQLKHLAGVAEVLLLELAEASEALYWAPSLPADKLELVHDIGFIYPLGVFPTHLGEVERSLYFCSDRIWHLGSSTQRFERWTEQSHEFAGTVHQGTRRYFFAKDWVAKTIRFVGMLTDHNRREFANESRFFSTLAPRVGPSVPMLEAQSVGSNPEFGHVVTKRLAGRTLAEMIVKGEDFDEALVLRQVLTQLSQLEQAGLYHRDVRVWNILVDQSMNVRLLDLAAINEVAADDSWPFDLFVSFLLFVGEVTSKSVPRVHLFRRPSLSSAWLREPYRSWFDSIWAQSHRDWTFAGFLALLDAPQATPGTQIHADNWALWRAVSERLMSDASDVFQIQREAIAARMVQADMQALQQSLDARYNELDVRYNDLGAQGLSLNRTLSDLNQANAELLTQNVTLLERCQKTEEAVAQREGDLQRKSVELEGINVELERITVELERITSRLAERTAMVEGLKRSTSWRLTSPLRAFARLLGKH